MSIYKSLTSFLILPFLLAGCASLRAEPAALMEHCTEWREIGPPAKATRVRLMDDKCTSARR